MIPYDPVSISRISLLHPKIANEVLTLFKRCYDELGVPIRITQGLRTAEEQNSLYAQGRTKPGPRVTNARAFESLHCFGLAADFCLLYPGHTWDLKYDDPNDPDKISEWMEVVNLFTSHGYEAGIYWPGKLIDPPHFQKTFGNTWQSLNYKRLHGQMKDGYAIIL